MRMTIVHHCAPYITNAGRITAYSELMDVHHYERRTTWLSDSTGLINPSTTLGQILTREAP
jgi:hypothetical protein